VDELKISIKYKTQPSVCFYPLDAAVFILDVTNCIQPSTEKKKYVDELIMVFLSTFWVCSSFST